MNVGSLFAGIGGFDLGFERAGMRTLWQVEQNDFCRAVLARHFPDAERFEDVREVGAHNLAPVDLLCGGFPCQDLSVAGKGAGIDGERSGLWAEFARIIGELRPRYVVVENVPALTRNEWLGRVLGDLASSGYDAEWDCIPASALGAPHQRDRIWLVAYLAEWGSQNGDGRALQGGAEHGRQALQPQRRGGGSGAVPDADGQRPQGARPPRSQAARGRQPGDPGGEDQLADADEERRDRRPWELGPGGWREPSDGSWWSAEPDVGRVADGVPSRMDRLSALGNALVPQIAEWIGRRILAFEREVQVGQR